MPETIGGMVVYNSGSLQISIYNGAANKRKPTLCQVFANPVGEIGFCGNLPDMCKMIYNDFSIGKAPDIVIE
jgi:hypothetical protein